MKRLTRIAPTPSGYLHLGNALNALVIWLWARQHGASILLRLDDLDQQRIHPEYVEDVFLTLEWLGLDWDVGPQDVQDFHSHWSQTLRLPSYQETLSTLVERNHAYYCHCSRTQWATRGYEGCPCSSYAPAARSEALIRLSALPTEVGFHDAWSGHRTIRFDPRSLSGVVRRRDGLPSYQIASVTDDVHFEVTHVIRGEDLSESTAVQRFIAQNAGLGRFLDVEFMHHPLVKNGIHKLSKSAGATSLKHLRDSGEKAIWFYRWASRCFGVDQAVSASELLDRVDMSIIPFSENLDL